MSGVVRWPERRSGQLASCRPGTITRSLEACPLAAPVNAASKGNLENENQICLGLVAIDDPHRPNAMRAMPQQGSSQGLANIRLRGQPFESSIDPSKQAPIVTGELKITRLCSPRQPNGRHVSGPL